MRRGLLLTPFLATLAVLALPALAANQTVTADCADRFTEKTVTVVQGESVTWKNDCGSRSHNVHFEDDSYVQPTMPQPGPWTESRTFNSTGTFPYFCDLHALPGGMGMRGTVIVEAAGSTPPPGTPGPTPSPTADTSAPILSLGGPTRQRVLRQHGVVVIARVGEAATVTASGSVPVQGISKVLKLKKVTKQLAPNVRTKLKLRLSEKALKTVRRAVTRGRQVAAKITVTAKDSGGNTRSAKRRIKLKT